MTHFYKKKKKNSFLPKLINYKIYTQIKIKEIKLHLILN